MMMELRDTVGSLEKKEMYLSVDVIILYYQVLVHFQIFITNFKMV